MNAEEKEVCLHILLLMPILYKRFVKDTNIDRSDIQYLHFLFVLKQHPRQTMTFYSKMTSLQKPNITVLVDRFVKSGDITRCLDENDRRLVYIELTEKGHQYLSERYDWLIEQMGITLSEYDEQEKKALYEHVKGIIKIINPTCKDIF